MHLRQIIQLVAKWKWKEFRIITDYNVYAVSLSIWARDSNELIKSVDDQEFC